MSNRLVLSKKSKCILISLIIIFDVVICFLVTPLIDGKKFTDHSGIYSYNDLFSSKTSATDMADIIQILVCDDNDNFTEVNAKEILGGLDFESVTPVKAVPIMIMYNPKDKICSASTVTLGSVLENFKINNDAVFKIADETGYIVEATLFSFCNDIYMFANIKDNTYVYDEQETQRNNAVRSTMKGNNKDIALFKLRNSDELFIKKYFSAYHPVSYTKIYPNWYGDLQNFCSYRIIAALLFIIQFPIVFQVAKSINRSQSEDGKHQSGDGTVIDEK